uniref:Uncharacterized protein n=1 Tax=Alexandrium catenella TaxID=2925 RepID=A0A7S1SFK3_ALECA
MGVVCCREASCGGKDTDSLLGWRAAAAVSRLIATHASLSQEVEATVADPDSLRTSATKFLASEEVLSNPGFTVEGVAKLKPEGSDWRGFIDWLLKRVRDVNGLGGPRFMVASWLSMKQLGRFPMNPADQEHILDAEYLLEHYKTIMDDKGKVGGRVICFSFFSHRWERPSSKAGGGGHPDSHDHKKARALAKFGEFGSCPIFAPHHDFEYFFWVDYLSIHQVDPTEKSLGVSVLCAYVAACIQIIMYNSDTVEYEPRAWTRLERLLGYSYCACPLFKYLDDGYPTKPVDVDTVVKRSPSTFKKCEETGSLMLIIRDPSGEDAAITDPSDAPMVRSLSDTVREATPSNPARVWHGVTELAFDECLIPLDTEHYGLDVEKQQKKDAVC